VRRAYTLIAREMLPYPKIKIEEVDKLMSGFGSYTDDNKLIRKTFVKVDRKRKDVDGVPHVTYVYTLNSRLMQCIAMEAVGDKITARMYTNPRTAQADMLAGVVQHPSNLEIITRPDVHLAWYRFIEACEKDNTTPSMEKMQEHCKAWRVRHQGVEQSVFGRLVNRTFKQVPNKEQFIMVSSRMAVFFNRNGRYDAFDVQVHALKGVYQAGAPVDYHPEFLAKMTVASLTDLQNFMTVYTGLFMERYPTDDFVVLSRQEVLDFCKVITITHRGEKQLAFKNISVDIPKDMEQYIFLHSEKMSIRLLRQKISEPFRAQFGVVEMRDDRIIDFRTHPTSLGEVIVRTLTDVRNFVEFFANKHKALYPNDFFSTILPPSAEDIFTACQVRVTHNGKEQDMFKHKTNNRITRPGYEHGEAFSMVSEKMSLLFERMDKTKPFHSRFGTMEKHERGPFYFQPNAESKCNVIVNTMADVRTLLSTYHQAYKAQFPTDNFS